VSGSLLSVLFVPVLSGPAKGPFVPYLGWVSLQRSCLSDPCNPFFFFAPSRRQGCADSCSTQPRVRRAGCPAGRALGDAYGEAMADVQGADTAPGLPERQRPGREMRVRVSKRPPGGPVPGWSVHPYLLQPAG
jgi:hypothetical protein